MLLIYIITFLITPNNIIKPNQPNHNVTLKDNSFPTQNDLTWMRTSYNNSDMFIHFSNGIYNIITGTQDHMNSQRLIFCSGEVTKWARSAQQQSEDMEVSSELQSAKTEYEKATGEYAMMGDYINDGVLAIKRGNLEDGEKLLTTGLEHYQSAKHHYTNYLVIIQKFGIGI